VQFSRFRFFMEELCSRRCSDGQSGLPAEGVDSNSVAKYERVDNDIKRIHTTLERLEGVRDVISLPDFRSDDLKAECSGHHLNLAHFLRGGYRTSVHGRTSRRRQAAE
jgi:hypothetical protein